MIARTMFTRMFLNLKFLRELSTVDKFSVTGPKVAILSFIVFNQRFNRIKAVHVCSTYTFLRVEVTL